MTTVPTSALSVDDVQALRQVLLQRAAVLLAEASRPGGGTSADVAEREVRDREEEAERVTQAGIDSAEVERDLAELREIDAALKRIADGRFGLCADCGEPIGRDRLAVQPAALRCAECQAGAEHLPRR